MGKLLPWIVLGSAVILAATSSTLMRIGGAGLDFSKGLSMFSGKGCLWLTGLALGWISGLGYSLVLTRLPLTEASALYMPLAYIAILLCGVFILHEDISFVRMIGVGIVFVGLLFCAGG